MAFGETLGMDRYRCDVCDFDYCFKCLSGSIALIKKSGNETMSIMTNTHPHPLKLFTIQAPWFCDMNS